MSIGILFFVLFPGVLMALYDSSGLWNPFMGVDEDGDPVKFVTYYMCMFYWGGLWLMHKAATSPSCMPKPLKQIYLAFRRAQQDFASWRYMGFDAIEDRFKEDLIQRTDLYLQACKKASPEEIAVSALSDIALDLNFREIHEKAWTRLEQIEANRSRLERILVRR